ncbi:hypothetical protein B0H19DRAFT_1373969 [Mycena capillaripes]|nr:hypothetical protein B0H19DRAFT_1373969 [Mycena capillaripes]
MTRTLLCILGVLQVTGKLCGRRTFSKDSKPYIDLECLVGYHNLFIVGYSSRSEKDPPSLISAPPRRNGPSLGPQSCHQRLGCTISGTNLLRVTEPTAAVTIDFEARAFVVIEVMTTVAGINPKDLSSNPALFVFSIPLEIDCLFEPRAVNLASDLFSGTESHRNRCLRSSFPCRYSSRDTSEKTQELLLLLLDVAPLSLAIETAGPPPSSAHPTEKSEIFSLTPTTIPAYEGELARTEDLPQTRTFSALYGAPQVELTFDVDTQCLRLRLQQYRQGESSHDETDDNALKSSAYNLRNSLNNEKLADKFATAGNFKLEGAVNDIIKRLNVSQEEDYAEACIGIVSIQKALLKLPDPAVSLLSSPKADFSTSDALLSPIILIFILAVMQCRILIAFAVSCMTLSVAAAPIADSSILDRTPSQAVECTLASEDLKTVHSHTLFTAKPIPSSHPFGPCDSLVSDALENVTRAVTVSSRRFFVELYF